MHERLKTGHLGRQFSACGRKADFRQAVTGDDEFEYRRGRARACGDEQQGHGRDQRNGAKMHALKKLTDPRPLWRS